MTYYLEHFFDPDFNHLRLKPRETESGRLDFQEMGYVQNVVEGQVLARWREVSPDESADLNPHFLFDAKKMPAGPNTGPDPADPDTLLAKANGYVFYNEADGLITVKRTLNVRGDVGPKTGNVIFVGDVVVHGAVHSGYRVHGRNLHIRENVLGGETKAASTLLIEGGVSGGRRSRLEAGGDMQFTFCDNAKVFAGNNLKITKDATHSEIYGRRNILVGGRVIGGRLYCEGQVMIRGNLGRLGVETRLVLGYDPFLLRKGEKIEGEILEAEELRTYYLEQANKQRTVEYRTAYQENSEKIDRKISLLKRRKAKIMEAIAEKTAYKTSRLLVRGEVRTGVDIAIGPAYMELEEPLQDVILSFDNGRIRIDHP